MFFNQKEVALDSHNYGNELYVEIRLEEAHMPEEQRYEGSEDVMHARGISQSHPQ